MRIHIPALFSLLLLSVMPAAATAQATEGRLIGQVVDAESQRPLPGASIQLVGSNMTITAGLDGRFLFLRVPAGDVSLTVMMLGYQTKTITGIAVEANGVARIDVTLESQAIVLEGITISAQQQRGSAANALAEQRNAKGVQNAVTAEQISRSPDSDAADAIRRVSGVTVQDNKFVFVRGLGERYTTSSLNGARIPSPEPERKVVPLDLFPASLIQTITTAKTFSPDQPGDFSGAQVDIRMHDFPIERKLTFSASSSFNPDVTGRGMLAAPTSGGEWLAVATSGRGLPNAAAQMPSDASRGPAVNEIVNSFRNVWSVQEQQGRPASSLGFSLGGSNLIRDRTFGYQLSATHSHAHEANLDERRARAGTGGSELDRFDGSSGQTSTLWGGLVNLGYTPWTHTRISLNNSYNRSAENQARMESGTDENTSSRVQVERLRYVERTVRSNQLTGEHQLSPRQRLDWTVTASAVSRQEPDRSEFVTWIDPEVPVWFNDFEGAVRTFGGLTENSLEGGVNHQVGFGGTSQPHLFRFGGSYRGSNRDATSQGFRIQSFFWSETDERWQRPPEQIFDGRYAGEGDANFLLSRELSGGSYTASDRLLAGYGMVEYALTERIGVVTGARVERSEVEVSAQNQLGQPSFVDPSYTDILPSVSVNIDLAERQKLRFAASRTLARPEYRELAPITYREVLGGEQVIGNPDLERTLIQNYDIRWEWYPAPVEVISLGVFGKRFSNPIEQRFLARSGTNTRTFENAESATNYGVEMEVVKALDILSDRLSPYTVFTNVTVMRSSVNTGVEGDAERAMVGQAPYVVNSGITYTDARRALSATLLYNVVGERIVNARASGTQVDDVVERPRRMVDASLRFPFYGNMSGKLDAKNLLDAPTEIVQGAVTRQYHRTGRSFSVGFTWTPEL